MSNVRALKIAMPFSAATTTQVKRMAHFQCCLCKALGVEVHHILPQAKNGSDAIDNAAPLCPSCHETYGENPTKRKFIREARDLWYEICEKRYASEPSLLKEIRTHVLRSTEDISRLRSDMERALDAFNLKGGHRTIQLPLSRKSGKAALLSLRDLLVLASAASERPKEQVELLCLRELWPLREGLRTSYNAFKRNFGEVTLRHLAAYALDELKVDRAPYLTEPDLESALGVMTIMVVCFNGMADGELVARFNENGEVAWKANPERERSNLSIERTRPGKPGLASHVKR